MKHPGINGCCHQVIGCCDGMNVTSQMQIELWGRQIVKKDTQNRNEEDYITDTYNTIAEYNTSKKMLQ